MKITKRQLRRIIRESLENTSLFDIFSGWDPTMVKQAIELNEYGGEFPQPIGTEVNYHPPKRNFTMDWRVRFKFDSREEAIEFEDMVINAGFAIKMYSPSGDLQAKVGDFTISRDHEDIKIWEKLK